MPELTTIAHQVVKKRLENVRALLTLVVVPVVYTCLDDLAAWARHRWNTGGTIPAPRRPVAARSPPCPMTGMKMPFDKIASLISNPV